MSIVCQNLEDVDWLISVVFLIKILFFDVDDTLEIFEICENLFFSQLILFFIELFIHIPLCLSRDLLIPYRIFHFSVNIVGLGIFLGQPVHDILEFSLFLEPRNRFNDIFVLMILITFLLSRVCST